MNLFPYFSMQKKAYINVIINHRFHSQHNQNNFPKNKTKIAQNLFDKNLYILKDERYYFEHDKFLNLRLVLLI